MRELRIYDSVVVEKWHKPGIVPYVASPYSHSNLAIRSERYCECINFFATAQKKGLVCYSPIIYTHHLAMEMRGSVGYKDWKLLDEAMIEKCDFFLVLKLPGWDTSEGIMCETEFAIENDKYVSYVNLTDYGYKIEGGLNG